MLWQHPIKTKYSLLRLIKLFDFGLQVLGSVPTVTIDKTDGCQMYLNEQSKHIEIVSSKSSEMNVLLPNASGEFVSFLDVISMYFC